MKKDEAQKASINIVAHIKKLYVINCEQKLASQNILTHNICGDVLSIY
jgi:hypothetical protein